MSCVLGGGVRWGLCPCFHSFLVVASDGSSSTSFSSSVLSDYGRVVVLVSLTATSSVWSSLTSQRYLVLLEFFGVYGIWRLQPVLIGSASCTGCIHA
ncbi:hypothetical protein N665_0516s0003 [Sinapis alba]|nr:hypothetical protein N665_0516s0003 [Sinapis alba]